MSIGRGWHLDEDEITDELSPDNELVINILKEKLDEIFSNSKTFGGITHGRNYKY